MKFGLSKSKILSGHQCEKRLWLEKHRPELLEWSDGASRTLRAGHTVNETARSLWPNGVLVDEENPRDALRRTAKLLKQDRRRVIFEAAFETDGVLVRTDVIERVGSGYRITEVKSATECKDYYLLDAAVQTWVARAAGLPVKSTRIAYVNSKFVYPGNDDYAGLFVIEDVTKRIAKLVDEVPLLVKKYRRMLGKDMPDIATGPHCNTPYECPFQSFCAPPATAFPVEILPRASKLHRLLREEGYSDLRKVPAKRLTNATHRRVHRITVKGRPELLGEARSVARKLPYPRFYLDFETAQFPVPIWPGTRPYEQIPFQWSCHIETAQGKLRHRTFLDLTGEAPMGGFIGWLLKVLGGRGPVIVYSNFEKTQLKALALCYPELAGDIRSVIGRLVDLLPLAKANYYHPEMMGSWSMKSLLPTLAPDLSYDTVGEVQDGGGAMDAYLEAIDPDCLPDRRAALSKALHDYCKLDTLGLVRMVQAFAGKRRVPKASA